MGPWARAGRHAALPAGDGVEERAEHEEEQGAADAGDGERDRYGGGVRREEDRGQDPGRDGGAGQHGSEDVRWGEEFVVLTEVGRYRRPLCRPL